MKHYIIENVICVKTSYPMRKTMLITFAFASVYTFAGPPKANSKTAYEHNTPAAKQAKVIRTESTGTQSIDVYVSRVYDSPTLQSRYMEIMKQAEYNESIRVIDPRQVRTSNLEAARDQISDADLK